ncbi:hypothetical protein FSP39_009602 [Pinctada imbricata]|uniref:Enhancer of mRNA-decapping protein 3 n=1 Tax=Pinctada imbricata TaxID=66713 RepID=A0AA88YDQ0_PINIB|nr:hypothetical protein FSP39_009602 [Pinctada imbricata]
MSKTLLKDVAGWVGYDAKGLVKDQSSLCDLPVSGVCPYICLEKRLSAMSFVGSIVSLDCGESLGTYQGQVMCINNSSQDLTIHNAYRNGLKCSVPEITINACDIKELKIIKDPKEADQITAKEATPCKLSPENNENEVFCPSPVKVVDTPLGTSENGVPTKRKQSVGHDKYQCSYVDSMNGNINSNGIHRSRSDQKFPSSNGVAACRRSPMNEPGRFTPPARTSHTQTKMSPPGSGGMQKNVKFTPTKENQQSGFRPRRNSASDMKSTCTSKRSTTPRKIDFRKRSQSRDQQDDCFSAPNHSYLTDFDFEKNLALFDKKAVFEEIENANPDCVKVVEAKKPQKYRCDENVLQSGPVVLQQIKVPNNVESVQQFVTDAGLIVPTISYELRTRLFSAATKFGFREDRQIEMVGRSVSEMVLQLLGGSTRLNPTNGHQLPTVVVLCGPHRQGAQGVNCARHLSNHNVKVKVFVPSYAQLPAALQEELNLFKFCDGIVTSSLQDLPSGAVDIIISAVESHDNDKLYQQGWFVAVTEWANQNRAPALSMDPPLNGSRIKSKWSLSICLPLNFNVGTSQNFLCDLGFPKKVFQEVGIKYLSPFGHKFIIPLHPRS